MSPLDALSIFLLITLVILVIIICYLFVMSKKSDVVTRKCEPDPSTLLDLTNVPCCYGTNNKFLKSSKSILSQFPTDYNKVCDEINDPKQKQDCISALQPKNCQGQEMPTGYDNGYYYVISYDLSTCTKLTEC